MWGARRAGALPAESQGRSGVYERLHSPLEDPHAQGSTSKKEINKNEQQTSDQYRSRELGAKELRGKFQKEGW